MIGKAKAHSGDAENSKGREIGKTKTFTTEDTKEHRGKAKAFSMSTGIARDRKGKDAPRRRETWRTAKVGRSEKPKPKPTTEARRHGEQQRSGRYRGHGGTQRKSKGSPLINTDDTDWNGPQAGQMGEAARGQVLHPT